MIILSFDIGIKNMAYCLMDIENDKILLWDIIDIGGDKKNDLNQMSTNLIEFLDDMLIKHLCDINKLEVLIENQPVMKAPTMKSIQMVIYTYFKIQQVHGSLNANIYLVSASRKNTYMKSKGYDIKAKTYKSNKDNSILFVKDYLIKQNDIDNINKLETYKKKDDLCDSLIQLLSFYNK